MHDIQLVDFNFTKNSEEVEFDDCLSNLENLRGYCQDQLRAKSQSYIDRLSHLELEIQSTQAKITEAIETNPTTEELVDLKNQQVLKVNEHSNTIQELEGYCQSQHEVTSQIAELQNVIVKAEANVQQKEWELLNARAKIDNLTRALAVKSEEVRELHDLLARSPKVSS